MVGQYSYKKKTLFLAVLMCFSFLFVECSLHLLTFAGIISVNPLITPWCYQQNNAKYCFDDNGSPIFINGVKAYNQKGIPILLQEYDEKGYRPTDSARFKSQEPKIGFFGDSYTEGLQVLDEKTFPRVFERKLRQINVNVDAFNFGIGGTGTYNQYMRYLTVSNDVDLDIVILCFLPINDVLNNHERLNNDFELYKAPYLTIRDNKFISNARSIQFDTIDEEISLLRRTIGISFIAKSIYNAPLILKKKNGSNGSVKNIWITTRSSWLDVYNPPKSKDWIEAWAITEEVIQRFASEVKKRKSQFILLIVADYLQISFNGGQKQNWANKYNFNYPNCRLSAFCRKHEIQFYDSLPFFLKQKAKLPPPFFSYKYDGHYSQIGHTTMADFLLEKIFKNGIHY